MNRISIIIVAFLLVLSSSISAQDFQLGIKGGLTASKVRNVLSNSDNSISFFEWGLGYNAGFALTSRQEGFLGYDMELGVVSKKFKHKDFSQGIDFTYLNIPVHATFKLAPSLKLLVGPDFNYSFDSKPSNKFDLGASVGLNYQMMDKFGIRMRYTRGMSAYTSGGVTDVNGAQIGTFKSYFDSFFLSGIYYFK